MKVQEWLQMYRDIGAATHGEPAAVTRAVGRFLSATSEDDFVGKLNKGRKQDSWNRRVSRELRKALASRRLDPGARAKSKALLDDLAKEPSSEQAELARQKEVASKLVTNGRLSWTKEWSGGGFPQIVVDPRLFASLAATEIPQEAIPDLGMPWNCWVLRVPEEFMTPMEWIGGAKPFSAGWMMCRTYIQSTRWLDLYIFASEDPRVCASYRMTDLAGLHGAKPGRIRNEELRGVCNAIGANPDNVLVLADLATLEAARVISGAEGNCIIDPETGDRWDMRMRGAAPGTVWLENAREMDRLSRPAKGAREQLATMCRAFAGVALEMMDVRHKRAVGELNRARGAKRNSQTPASMTYKLCRPVKVDCRDWLRSTLSGQKSKSPTVQTLVRGHWKRQRCGPGGSERKYIHIEPYWRGPEDAPIAVREHVLKSTHGSTEAAP